MAGVAGATLVASTSTASSRPAGSLADPSCEVGARVDPLAPTLDRVKRPRVPVDDPPLLPPRPLLAEPTASASTRAATTAPSLVAGFGQGGKVTTNLARSRSGGTDVALQSDGKIVVVGHTLIGANSNFVVARYLRDGRLDPGFGAGGTVMTDFGGEDGAAAIAIQPDAKIVVVGSTKGATTRVALARYERDGGLDQSFGAGGKVVMHLAGRGADALSTALDVAIDGNRRIVVAGTSRRTIGRSTRTLDFVVARYTPRGVLDTTFGSDGVTTIDFGRGNDVALGLALQRNGSIVVAGSTVPPGDVLIIAAVARLQPGGALDPTFGAGGRATLLKEFLWRSWEAVAVQHDGKIVVAGWGSNCLTFVFSVARYTRTGALDTGFGVGGSAETSPSGVLFDFATDVALLPDGRILAGGVTVDPANWDYDYALVRYRANGRLDALRRGAPPVTVLRPSAGDDVADGLTVQPDGRTVLATSSGRELGAARVTAAGGLDGSFGTGGVASSHASAAADFGRDVIVQPDGMIVVAGVVMFGQIPAGALVRYGPDGTRDPAFQSPLSIVRPSSLAFVEGGRVATVGECCNSGQGESGYAQGLGTRYLPDGREEGFVLGLASNSTALRRAGLLGVAAVPSGTAVAAGFVETAGKSDFALARWDREWRRDASFGTNGTVTTAIGSGNERAAAIVRQPDGKAVVAGFTDRDGTEDFALVRYLENGSLDLTFGSGGVVVTPFGSGHDRATSLALQPDGRIVVAVWTRGAAGADVAMARYRADGTLDPSFGTGGKAVFALASGEETAADVLVRADGVILVAATVGTGAAADFALARISPNGGVVETTRTDFSGGEDVARALAPMADGTVVVAGSAYSARWDHDFALARYSVP